MTRPERAALGAALRAARVDAGITTRGFAGYSSGHVSQVENGKVLPSEDMVRAYIGVGGEPGRLLGLLDRARALRSASEDPVAANELSSPRSDPYLLRRGYTIESVHDVHSFGAERRLLSMTHRTVVHPVHERARFFPIRYSYQDDPRPGVATVEGAGGCVVAMVEEDAIGVVYAVLDFLQAPRDEVGAVEVAWEITVTSSVPSRPQVVAGTSTRLPVATVGVEFTAQSPAEIWPFRGFDERAGLSKPGAAAVPLVDRRHHQRFENLETEWWGLAWTWPSR